MRAAFSYFLFIFLVIPVPWARAASNEYLIGTYYFPGWTAGAKGLEFPDPWGQFVRFPEKEPLLGWYSDSDPAVLKKQAQMMREAGIGFVAFDWYWNGKETYLEHAINAFRRTKPAGDLKYTILWANHYKFPGGLSEFKEMVGFWVRNYFSDQGFLTIDGKPVVFVFSVEFYAKAAESIGVSPAELTEIVNSIAREGGFSGVYLVGGVAALEHWAKGVAPAAGFSALSAYNYHRGYSGSAESMSVSGSGFARLAAAYRQNWNWLVSKSTLPYIVPMTSGWDKRPWGGSRDSSFDDSISTPAEFEAHLREAKALMDEFPNKTLKMGVVCCWNEFGEGSYIEPTKRGGKAYLEKIKDVFGGD